eukprot:CAMPEP_0182584952 /NCGR_PEP_ID=MMETSP1324-20130603/59098_1 /TAXON_ID=236786 /ORGANISM="Florenciella sp., Strain RCC1587" /LENGTH=86 /DNA_ID=CAMNT_0024801709 /DNA_START=99 /DNA_END=356 /DNA_ORIENTATION=+
MPPEPLWVHPMHVATPGRPRVLVPVVVPVPLAELGLTLLLVLSRPSVASHVVSRPFAFRGVYVSYPIVVSCSSVSSAAATAATAAT